MRSRSSVFIFAFGLFASSIAAAHESSVPTKPKSVPGQYIVALKPSASAMSAKQLELSLGGKIIDHVRSNLVVIQRPQNENLVQGTFDLRSNSNVLIAEPNYIYSATKTPSDAEFAKQWGLSNQGALDESGIRGLKGVDIGAEKAWDKTTGSKSVVVAVIDTGIDFKIPDLADNAWTNAAEAKGLKGVDDDGNGYVDDIHGYNFVSNTGDPTDDNNHGSHCAGVIGARGDDGKGIAGISWNVSLMAVKFLDSNGSGSLANAIKAIDYARKNGAQILSNSWGGSAFAETLLNAIQETENAGELFVVAAGNDSSDNDKTPAYPSSYKLDNIVSVAAVDQQGRLADFSNFGATSVHIAAPGVAIYSTTSSGFEFMSGTSMATPHVSGAAALLLADNPHLTYQDLKKRLMAAARPLHALSGKIASGGILDISFALSGQTPPPDPNDASLWKGQLSQTVSTAHPYANKLNQTFTVKIPGASRIALHFSRFETESNYDVVELFNKKGECIGRMSGTQSGEFSPIADGDTIVMKLKTDDSITAYGFDVDSASFER